MIRALTFISALYAAKHTPHWCKDHVIYLKKRISCLVLVWTTKKGYSFVYFQKVELWLEGSISFCMSLHSGAASAGLGKHSSYWEKVMLKTINASSSQWGNERGGCMNRGNHWYEKRNSARRSPIKMATQDQERSLQTAEQALAAWDSGNEASWCRKKIGLICRYSRASTCAALQISEEKYSISITARLGMWQCLCENAPEGVFGVFGVKTADVYDCIQGKIVYQD